MNELNSASLPDQNQKNKTKEEFYRQTYDYYINRAISMNDKTTVRECLNAADGIIDESTLQYVITPLVMDDQDQSDIKVNIPGTIRNFDFITPIKEKNLGEYIELPYTKSIKIVNPDVTFIRDTKMKRKLASIAQDMFIQQANAKAQQAQAQQQQASQNPVPTNPTIPPYAPELNPGSVDDPKKFQEQFIEDYVDERAIQASHLLNLIDETNNFDLERIKMYYYWWACEEFYTVRMPMNNILYKETISPLEGYPVYNNMEFVEDYDAFVIVKDITLDQFLTDSRVLELSDKDIEFVKQIKYNQSGQLTAPTQLLNSRIIEDMPRLESTEAMALVYNTNNTIRKHIIFWPTFVEHKYRIYVNALGQTREEIVDNDYQINLDEGDIEIKNEMIPEIWVGYRYGTGAADAVYIKPERFPIQRYDENTKRVKLPIGGKLGILRDIKRNPIPKRLIPYMAMDKIYSFQIERMIKKFREALTVIPKSLLNSDAAGSAVQKYQMMYADDQIIYDDTNVDLQTIAQGFRVIGQTNGAQYLNSLLTLRNDNEARANRVANMNDERMGLAQGSDAVTNVQQNIYRAKVGTLLMITMFNKALELDHQSDLECAKYIYTEPFDIAYMNKDGNQVTHQFDPESFYTSQLGVYVRNSRVEEAVLQEYRKLAQAMAQNDNPELAILAIGVDNVAEMKKAMKTFTKAKREYEASLQQQKLDNERFAIDKADQQKTAIIAGENYRADEANRTKIEVATLMAGIEPTDEGADYTKDLLSQRKVDLAEKKQEFDMKYKDKISDMAKQKLDLAKNKPTNK